MASKRGAHPGIRKRMTKAGPVYDVRMWAPHGDRQMSRSFPRLELAKAFQAEQRAARAGGRWIDPAGGKRTFAEVAAEWAESDPGKRATSKARDRMALERWVLPSLGARPIASITAQIMQAAVNDWSAALAPSTVGRTFSVARAVLTYAVDHGTQTMVGHTQIAQGAVGWKANLTYEATNSTARMMGFSWTTGSGPLSFGYAGAAFRGSTLGTSGSANYQGNNASATNRKQMITTAHYYDEYRCWNSPTTPPAYAGSWPVVGVMTVPGGWVRDYVGANADGAGVASCPADHDSVHGPGSFSRTSGSSYSIEDAFTASVNVGGKQGIFKGDAAVKITRASGQKVTQTWSNQSTGNKKLCAPRTGDIAGTGNVGVIVAKA